MTIFSSPLTLWACILCIYHSFEFTYAFFFDRDGFGLHSLLITKQYLFALSVGLLEYLIETHFFPGMMEHSVCRYFQAIGLALVICGLSIRFGSMLQNTGGFTHIIQTKRKDDHELRTSGFYRISRHPSYLGWFIFSPATQLLLCNPVSWLAYLLVSWKFFADRIPYEEYHLVRMFGADYVRYRKRVGTGIPFIK